MIALAWRGREGARVASRLVALLYRAAERDPLLERIAGTPHHCDGYGYMLAARRPGGGWLVEWSRYDAADTLGVTDEACRENLEALKAATSMLSERIEGLEEGFLLLHARKASRGEPRGSLYAHPYLHTVAGRSGQTMLALVHNGGVDKASLASWMGVDESAYTDSQLLTVWIARQVASGATVEEALRAAESYIKPGSALDVAILLVNPGQGLIELHIYSKIHSEADEARREYYKPIFFRGEGVQGYMSSTVKMYADTEGLNLEYEEGIEGRLYSYIARIRGS
jgi:glutamine amidotransferase